MRGDTNELDRIQEVKRIFEEQGFGNAELLEGWDGADLNELLDLVSEEEFQVLLDQLEVEDDRAVR